ncbi:MAG: flagellar assembly peptidoglycan hydrolase FlgJ [Marinagarivorans sp.]|nr:flagellar assembly peptidoglycan hydrolase FlgJ [Marinagarivorans sp.]
MDTPFAAPSRNYSGHRQSSSMAYTDLASVQKIKSDTDKDAALHKAAKQFESMFIGLLFKGMRQANEVFEEGNMGHSHAEKTFRDMYDQQMAMDISNGRGLGIADMVYKQLKGNVRKEHVADELDASNMYAADKTTPTTRGIDALSALEPKIKEPLKIKAEPIKNTFANTHPAINNSEKSAQLSLESPLDFAKTLLPVVKDGAEALGLDPLIVIAQAALETGWGKHMIKDNVGQSSHNLFNIKADSRWQGGSVNTSTLEFKNGIAVKENAKFRQYSSVAQSVDDYLNFVKNNPRYQNAMNLTGNAHAYIEELQNAGYATDPEYANKVKSVYQKIQTALTES